MNRYELLVAFSMRLDDWKMIEAPDDFDSRSHDVLVTQYRNKLQAVGALERADALSDKQLLVDYVTWLDNEGTMTTWGPTDEDALADRFLNELATGRTKTHA